MKASSRTPTWFHACEVAFVDAADADEARCLVSADPALEVWEVVPATPALEAHYQHWVARAEQWRQLAATASAKRGIL